MAWKLKTVLDSIAIGLMAVGAAPALQGKPEAALVVAVGVFVKAVAEYLYEKGVIEVFSIKKGGA
jgi:hypothetical protein